MDHRSLVHLKTFGKSVLFIFSKNKQNFDIISYKLNIAFFDKKVYSI